MNDVQSIGQLVNQHMNVLHVQKKYDQCINKWLNKGIPTTNQPVSHPTKSYPSASVCEIRKFGQNVHVYCVYKVVNVLYTPSSYITETHTHKHTQSNKVWDSCVGFGCATITAIGDDNVVGLSVSIINNINLLLNQA